MEDILCIMFNSSTLIVFRQCQISPGEQNHPCSWKGFVIMGQQMEAGVWIEEARKVTVGMGDMNGFEKH
jgi:hypothetical protein